MCIKRLFFVAALCLASVFASSAEATQDDFEIVVEGTKKGLINSSGEIVIPVIYENLGWSDGSQKVTAGVIGYFENGKWGLINTRNTLITDPAYAELYPANDQFFIASRKRPYAAGDIFGLLDRSGRALLGFQYRSLDFDGNNFVVSQLIKGEAYFGIVGIREQLIIPIKYDAVKACIKGYIVSQNGLKAFFGFDGRAKTGFIYNSIKDSGPYLQVTDHHGKVGLINSMGQGILETKFKAVDIPDDSTIVITEFPQWELLTTTGTVIKQFSYDSILPVNHGVFKASVNGRQALINLEEEYVISGDNWNISVPDTQFIIVEKNRKNGVLREGGLEVIPMIYDSIHYSGKHFYTMKLHEGLARWQIYSTFGNLISSNYFEAMLPMSEELIPTRKNGYWGYIDFAGHTVIEYVYDYVGSFSQGRAKVRFNGLEGVINTVGDWIVPPTVGDITLINEHIYLKQTGGRNEIYDLNGNMTYYTSNQIEEHSFGLLERTEDNHIGLIDLYGRSALMPVYDEVKEGGSETYILRKGVKFGFINRHGRFILPMTDQYQAIEKYSEGFLRIKSNDRYGFVDLDGNLRIANRYEDAMDFSNGVAAIKLLDKWGFIDRLERLIIQPHYDGVNAFLDGVCIASKKGQFGIIDLEGREVLAMKYDTLFRNGFHSLVLRKESQYGLASPRGELLVHAKYDELTEDESSLLIVKKREKYGVIDKRGINIIPTIYDRIIYDDINGYYLAARYPEKTMERAE